VSLSRLWGVVWLGVGWRELRYRLAPADLTILLRGFSAVYGEKLPAPRGRTDRFR
jgi:hypothetical protein